MKGNPKVIAQLQKLLASELTAIDQYFIHSRMYEDWGYTKLFERLDHETDEKKNREILQAQRQQELHAQVGDVRAKTAVTRIAAKSPCTSRG